MFGHPLVRAFTNESLAKPSRTCIDARAAERPDLNPLSCKWRLAVIGGRPCRRMCRRQVSRRQRAGQRRSTAAGPADAFPETAFFQIYGNLSPRTDEPGATEADADR
jgi:hypothetical protein